MGLIQSADRPPCRLQLLGAARVLDPRGVPLDGALAQRRPLALLSVLAVAGPAGVTRDRLVGLLWPDAEPQRARHALTQLIYHVRRALNGGLIAGNTDVRLDPATLSSDVERFETLSKAGRWEEAIEYYRGPFLDGFYLPGAGEFEEWASRERTRFGRLAWEVLENLAGAAEDDGAWDLAVRWRSRQVVLEPCSSLATLRLMRARVAAGDAPGALLDARAHTESLRRELDLGPDPAVQEFAAKLRAQVASPPPVELRASPTNAASPVFESRPTAFGSVRESSTAASGTVARARRRHAGTLWSSVLLAVMAFLATAWFGRKQRAVALSAAEQRLAVVPFRMTLGDSSLAYLGEGIVDLLSAKLRGGEHGGVVDPALVLRAWRATAVDGRYGEEAARAVGRRVGAGWVIGGSIVGDASRLILQAVLLSAATGERRAQVEVEGSTLEVVPLIDRLAVKLLALREGERDEERLEQITSTSPLALRAFLAGQSAFRGGDYQSAVTAYDQALRLDSSFALAALHLALAADRVNDAEQHDRALAIAWRLRHELTRVDRAVLTAFAGPRYPLPSPDQEQVDAWEQVVMLAPDLAYAWLELGERYFHNGAVLGLPDAHLRAAVALQRAIRLDSTSGRARTLLALLAAREGDSARLANLQFAGFTESAWAFAPAVRWRVALATGDMRTLRAIRADMPALGQASLRTIAMLSLYDGVGVSDGVRAVRLLAAHARGGQGQLDALLAEHAVALNQGRPILALDVTERLQEAFPVEHPHLRLRVLDALYGGGDLSSAARAADSLRRLVARRPSSEMQKALRSADMCVLAQWELAEGRLRDVQSLLGELSKAEVPVVPVPVGANPFACASVVGAQLAVRARAPDAERAVRALDSLALGGPAVSDAASYAPIVVAHLLRDLGDLRGSLEAVRRRGYMNGWPRYLATMRYLEATLAIAVGDSAGALPALERYLAWRVAPEAKARAQVDSAQRLVRVLRGHARR